MEPVEAFLVMQLVGGIFRDSCGAFHGCFSIYIGMTTALHSELYAVNSHGCCRTAHSVGWNRMWLECGSKLLVLAFENMNLVPQVYRSKQKHCLQLCSFTVPTSTEWVTNVPISQLIMRLTINWMLLGESLSLNLFVIAFLAIVVDCCHFLLIVYHGSLVQSPHAFLLVSFFLFFNNIMLCLLMIIRQGVPIQQ